ncbi:hypothetical protein G7085_12810 [Tessaracoccus sp. HDW20]|uniref:hypothetical protein n=1 Tax=Tessaracoccus coleopterorum TaxID=2714950 RepID=UPI0018D4A7A2|nr:hypothetical protein [Tessaracoccus coleopterorum]NHB85206.1 hypothetical protein [Tessaracoccus coleopterorum]
MSLICPPGSIDEALLDYDATVKVEVQLAPGRPWVQILFGWVSSITRTTRSDGRHVYALTLMDILGRAAATKIGMQPRPAELAETRMKAINTASRPAPRRPTAARGQCAPRDVDNFVALDLIRDTVQLGFNAVEGRDGLIVYQQGTAGPMLTVVTDPAWGNALGSYATGALP